MPEHDARRVLLVATPGGHLDELRWFVPRLRLDGCDVQWATSRTTQSEAIAATCQVHWLAPAMSGQYLRALLNLPRALAIIVRVRPDLIVTTGAALSVPFLILSRLLGIRLWYIESATRFAGPSKTGKLAELVTHGELFAQGTGWGNPRWGVIPDVFSGFTVRDREVIPRGVTSALVLLGAERWPFDRAVGAVTSVLSDVDVLWQIGNTAVPPGQRGRIKFAEPEALAFACRHVDVVISHAGIGSVLMVLLQGKVPVVLPRSLDRGEHVDNHQVELARALAHRGLAVVIDDPAELTLEHLELAGRCQVDWLGAQTAARSPRG